MQIEEIWAPLSGGMLIGASALLLMLLLGRVAGISGMLAGVLTPMAGQWGWRLLFLGGLLAAPLLARPWSGELPSLAVTSPERLALAGLLVGAGTWLANGCTSGHGICGVGRLSPRSLAATLAFMAAAMLTVLLTGGAA